MRRRIWIPVALGLGLGGAIWLWKTAHRDRFDLASNDIRRTWKPVVNLPWLNYGFDFGGVKGAAADTRLDDWFGQLEQDGVQAVSWFLFADGRASLTFDASGYVLGLSATFRSDYQSVLEAAKKHRLQIVWVLTDFYIGMPAEVVGSTRMFGHADLLEDPAKRASFVQNALVPLIRDRENHNQVGGWVVMNEPEHLLRSGLVSETTVREFVGEIAAAIRLYRPGDRVGLANSDLPSMMELADIDALDFLMFHHYRPYLPPPAAIVREYLRNHRNFTKSKPIFIGEFNLSSPPGLSLDQFVKTSANLGYAGVWPWSLRDRINESGTGTEEIEPQFDEIHSYVLSMPAPQNSPNDTMISTDYIEGRIKALRGEPEFHDAELKTNLEWASRCRAELADKNAKRTPERIQANLATAVERSRMHSYLQRETALELDWLRSLKQRR